MGVTLAPTFKPDGRLRGAYVYMLFCQDGGPVYVKVGMSINPIARLRVLRAGCPVTPKRFAFAETRSERRARQIERELQKSFKSWSAHGEWYAVPQDSAQEFKDAWRAVFAKMSEPAWPLRWEQINVPALARRDQGVRAMWIRRLGGRGRAYSDFRRDSRR